MTRSLIEPRWSPKSLARKLTRSLGFDVVRHPVGELLFLRELLVRVFDSLQINFVLDVGAHRGEYAVFLREIGYQAEIISFEPVTSTFAILQQSCAGDTHWHAYCFALGCRETRMPIYVAEGTVFSSFLTPNAFGLTQSRHMATTRTEMVTVRRLDTILEEFARDVPKPRIFLKIDTQGYDLHVLEGATGCLDRILALQTELSVLPIYEDMPDYRAALVRMNHLGFDVVGLFPVNRDEGLRVIEFDCVMVRSARAASARPEP